MNLQWISDKDPEHERETKYNIFFRYSSTIPLKEMFQGEDEESSDDEGSSSDNGEEQAGLHGNRYSATGS